ncbi:MAG: hypothetical protein BRC41_12785 [Cyanobacteria bacterium QH_9_48_43]|nr:MAG: hypothetical protein BRC41_12785 [Cyanobacteria bacterium QH_9_48_43]
MPLTALSEWAEKAIRAPFHLAGLELIRRPSRDADDQRIFFLHLPKCGGVSVNMAMRRAFGAQKVDGLNPNASRRVAERRGKDLRRFRTSLLFYYMAMENVNVISGHFSWNDDVYEQFSKKWAYVTVLRDPIRRWFSHYFYNRHKSGGYLGIEKDLPTFLHSERAREMGTHYTRRLSSPEATELNQAVGQAKVNLEKFEVLGLLDDMDAFADQFSSQFGVRLNIPTKNTSPMEDNKYEAMRKEEYINRVKEICKNDTEIYKYAHKLACK